MPLTDTGRTEAYAERSDAAWLTCLTFDHADLAVPIRVVDDNVDLARTVGGLPVPFNWFPFEITLPGQDPDNPTTEVTVQFEDPNSEVASKVRGLRPSPTLTVEVVTSKNPDVVERGPFVVTLQRRATADGRIVGTFGFEDILNDASPSDSYTPDKCPGLFA